MQFGIRSTANYIRRKVENILPPTILAGVTAACFVLLVLYIVNESKELPSILKKILQFFQDVSNIEERFDKVYKKLDLAVEKINNKQDIAVSRFGELMANLAALVTNACSNTVQVLADVTTKLLEFSNKNAFFSVIALILIVSCSSGFLSVALRVGGHTLGVVSSTLKTITSAVKILGSGAAIVTGAPLALVRSFYRGSADVGGADPLDSMPSGSSDSIDSGVSASISWLDRSSKALLDTSKKLDWICIPGKNLFFPPDPARLIKETGDSCAEGLGKRINDNLSNLSTKQETVMAALEKVPEKQSLETLLNTNHGVTTTAIDGATAAIGGATAAIDGATAAINQVATLQENHNTNLTDLTETVTTGMANTQKEVLDKVTSSAADLVTKFEAKSEDLSTISENTSSIEGFTSGINENLGSFGQKLEEMNQSSIEVSNSNTLSIINAVGAIAKMFSGGGSSPTRSGTPSSPSMSASPSSSQMRAPVLRAQTVPSRQLVRTNSCPNLPRATDDLFPDVPDL